MRFALLCDDSSVTPLLDALSHHPQGHQLTRVVRATPQADQLLHGRTGITFVDHWEDLISANDVDMVLIGGTDPQILEGAKQLASARIPLLLVPHAEHGSTFVYELSLIHDDNHVALYPLFWHRFDDAVIELKARLRTGELGRVQFLQLQRTLHRSTSNTPISQQEVDAELLADTDLLRWLMGNYNQITGLRTAASDQGVLIQSVVFAGRGLPEANWSISPVEGLSEWRLTVRGETGTAELRRDENALRWRLTIGDQIIQGEQATTADRVLSAVGRAVSSASSGQSSPPASDQGQEWSDVTQCFETVEATQRSVKRRRTIELHFEPMSERAIFKTQMTAIGCGLLVATLFLLLCYLGLASLVGPEPTHDFHGAGEVGSINKQETQPYRPIWILRTLAVLRLLIFAPLFLFLIAQLLLVLTRPASHEQSPQHQSG